jgi:hypothetical protein
MQASVKIACIPIVLLLACVPGPGVLAQETAADVEPATEPGVRATLLWAALQLVPGPAVSRSTSGETHFGLQWQVTPVLFSFGINRRLSPWRSFVVEPLTRQNGSVECFVAPEYTAAGDGFGTSWLFRGGLRGYFPLVEHGEYLSASLGAGVATWNGTESVHLDAGAHIFFGLLGLRIAYAPHLPPAQYTFTLVIRYF